MYTYKETITYFNTRKHNIKQLRYNKRKAARNLHIGEYRTYDKMRHKAHFAFHQENINKLTAVVASLIMDLNNG